MNRLIIKLAAVVVACLCATALFAEQEARYVVVLKRGANPPDIAALGGRIEAKNWWSLTVVIPVSAEKTLEASPAVESLQRTVVGTSDVAPEAPAGRRPRQASDSFAATTLSLSTLWNSGDYQYDGEGNITGIGTANGLNSDNKQSTFTYDLGNRLRTASIGRAAGDRTETYDYDGFGNLKTRQITSSPVLTYSPDPSLSTNRMQEAGSEYFATGNLKKHPNGDYFTYDAVNQIATKAATETGTPTAMYFYTPGDERIAVQTNGSVYWTVRDTDNKPLREYRSTTLTDANWSATGWTWVEDYIWSGDKLIAGEMTSANHGRRHFHLDHLGSPRLITDSARAQLSRHDYAPFGEEITAVNQELACCGREERINFTGHERDFDLTQTGDNDNYLDYMHARYYDPNRGRFLSVDPSLASANTTRPQTWNRYSYVSNNPLGHVDPDGRLQRDANGRLIFRKTAHGTMTHPSGHGGEAGAALGYLKADDGTHIEAGKYESGSVAYKTDCHGLTFADGKYWINNDQAGAILKGDHYKSTKAPVVGDVAIYRNAKEEIVHSATVSSVNEDGSIATVSGLGGVQMAAATTPAGPGPGSQWTDPNATVEYYHKPDDGRSSEQRQCDVEDIEEYKKQQLY